MPIDFAPPTSNIQGYQIAPPQSVDPLQTLAQMGQLRTQNLQAQQAQLGLKQTQMEVDSENAFKQAYLDANGDPDKAIALAQSSGKVLPKDIFTVQKLLNDAAQAKANLDKTRSEADDLRRDKTHALYQPMFDEKDPAKQAQMAANLGQQALSQGLALPNTVFNYTDPQSAQMYEASLNTEKWLTAQAALMRGKSAQQQAETAAKKQTIEEPGQIADVAQKQRTNAASQLGAAPNAAAYTRAYDALSPDLQKQFPAPELYDPATTPATVRQLGMTAAQQTQDVRAAATAAETKRHNLTDESTARLNASINAGRLAQEKLINGMKYGPDTAEYWVQQLTENPDSVKEMPPELRSNVGRQFMAKTGLPLPTPASAASQTQETAARNALDGAAFIQNAMKNPEIRANIGPIMGNLGNLEQRVGTAVGLSPQAEQLAQEVRTRMRYFVFQEGKAVLGGRMPEKLMGQLEASSPNVKMDPDMLQGALNGATGNAQTVIDNVDRQRFGGKMRTPAQRQGAAAGGNPPPAAGTGGKVAPPVGTTRQFKDGTTRAFSGKLPASDINNWTVVKVK